ncbi:hypothetical protein GE061_001482 [Apolygus lucorum]|uniref:E2 ubiquitin-conjugating enzyme n=1 Tax=Apolygus lucorum TaxID=248454 RepID=A0A6A4KKM0_APOLU|nr:hypothetical protein GE061_001482 [Apolygus lucorum]
MVSALTGSCSSLPRAEIDIKTGYPDEDDGYDGHHPTCYLCNGFYGPSFEEPVCVTCHAFLFPEEWSATSRPIFTEKTEDSDSGNDEPSDSFSGNINLSPVEAYIPAKAHIPIENRLKPPNIGQSDEVSSGLVLALPPEVLLLVFSFLDDMSLWSAGNVCRRWYVIMRTCKTSENWKVYTERRFPIYKPLCHIDDWYNAYTALMVSCPCKACLSQMFSRTIPHGEENSWRRHRLQSELKSLKADPPHGINAIPLDINCCHWQASITGPVGSPYEGGLFYLYLQVPYSYPMMPPIVRFITKVFHPNISRHGDIGLDSILTNWSLALTISKILISVQSLLTDPYCEVCMEPGVGKLYKDNKVGFAQVARAWTRKYAMHDVVSPKNRLEKHLLL